MRIQASTPAFDFAEQRFDHGHVVLAAIAWGEWEVLEQSVAEGLACEADAERRAEHLAPEELHAGIVKFRRSRRLLAGDEYVGWIAKHSLTGEDVLGHVRRNTLRHIALGRLHEVLASHTPSAEQLDEVIDDEAILSGRLRLWTERVARCAAALHELDSRVNDEAIRNDDEIGRLIDRVSRIRTSGLSENDIQARAPQTSELLAAESRFRSAVATEQRLERRLAEHRHDWQWLVWTELVFKSEGAAREAAMMVREDGIGLESAADAAQATCRLRQAYAAEVPELANLISAAVPGELVGPMLIDGDWLLACLQERAAVSRDDPVLRERATEELVEDALLRKLREKVTWHVAG